jgi:uncharacterized protein YndB with AHSA1/START domain
MNTTKITVETIVNADTRKVWDYYTNPHHIIKWNFASDDWHCPTAENDLRTGGKLRSRMEAKDGSIGFDFEATYNEIVPLRKIVYTIPDGRQAITDFSDSVNKTKVTIQFDAENQNPVEMQRGGWQAILDNFKKYTETH